METPGDAEHRSLAEVLDGWLTPKEAGKVAGITGRYVAMLAAQGKLEAVMTPMGRLIEPTQLAAYAVEHKARWKMPEAIERKRLAREQQEAEVAQRNTA